MALALTNGWRDVEHMSLLGTNWAAATVQAKWRGRKTRAIIKAIWAEADQVS